MKNAFTVMLFLVILCSLLVPAALALTASIGNARMILHAEAKPGSPAVIQKTIKVNNVNNITIEAILQPAGDIKDYTQMLDSRLILQPGESKDARFVVTLEYGGYYEGKILVDFRPSDSTIKATPVGLASTVIIIANGPTNPNPPSTNETEPTQPASGNPTEPNNPDSPSQPTQPAQNTQPADNPTQAQGPHADPLVGAFIIFIVLVVGAILYLWYIRR